MSLKRDIYESLILIAQAYGVTPQKERIQIYTDFLSEQLSAEQLKAAIPLIFSKCKFFPSIAEIVEIAKGSDLDNAHESVELIFRALREFGFYRAKEAKESLPENIWNIIQAFGGWSELCRIENSQLNTARAQLREIAKSNHRRKDYKQAINQDLQRIDFNSVGILPERKP